MSKVLVGANWFDELASTSFYENDYEGLIIQNRQSIFPDFHVLNFKKTVYSNEGAAQADLAIIDRKYRDWWVVEVELSHHSLQKHVLPQVRVLSAAYYRESEAMYLWRQMNALDLCRLRDLVRVRQPGVVVIVDSVKADWLQELKRFDILILMLQVFRSSFNEYIFRLNGDYPSMPHDIVSECFLDPILPRFLVVTSPAGLDIPRHGRIAVTYKNSFMEWERIDARDRIWLSPIGSNPLRKRVRYELLRGDDGSLSIREK